MTSTTVSTNDRRVETCPADDLDARLDELFGPQSPEQVAAQEKAAAIVADAWRRWSW